jgi:predicted transcriptional regulator
VSKYLTSDQKDSIHYALHDAKEKFEELYDKINELEEENEKLKLAAKEDEKEYNEMVEFYEEKIKELQDEYLSKVNVTI